MPTKPSSRTAPYGIGCLLDKRVVVESEDVHSFEIERASQELADKRPIGCEAGLFVTGWKMAGACQGARCMAETRIEIVPRAINWRRAVHSAADLPSLATPSANGVGLPAHARS